MQWFKDLVEGFSRLLDQIAGFCVFAMMAVIVVNIIMRAGFNRPILGTVDYVNILSAFCIALGLAFCAWRNGQIAVDFIYEKLPGKAQGITGILLNLIALCFWSISVWYMIEYAQSMTAAGLVASTVRIPMAPTVYLVALGLVALCLVLVVKLIDSLRKVIE